MIQDNEAPRRTIVAAWPRLLSIELAAQYLSLSASTLRAEGPEPKRHGRRVLYDIHDLDRWADRLDGQPLDDRAEEDEAAAFEKRWMDKRRARG
ncbi:hypothetical protein ASE95_02930 [Sphingomonas sp. Leaf231]|uniref:hypothetical protein n=1 Tax=Sphingomonas sp. Leaf231 TaxID=1736301 RepID=UPI0006FA5646|nr:hypothetical protein [Sphingomonas sp. Leaf231]KQN93874.1 hypothetical protein ASE95_02930 [Sphingomonas sp. Leaf231]